jgi:hypothetical protein
LEINVLNLQNLNKAMYLQLVYRINDRTIQEILQTLDKVVEDPSELARWTLAIETTAKV